MLPSYSLYFDGSMMGSTRYKSQKGTKKGRHSSEKSLFRGNVRRIHLDNAAFWYNEKGHHAALLDLVLLRTGSSCAVRHPRCRG
jgi:hypothetical protein